MWHQPKFWLRQKQKSGKQGSSAQQDKQAEDAATWPQGYVGWLEDMKLPVVWRKSWEKKQKDLKMITKKSQVDLMTRF